MRPILERVRLLAIAFTEASELLATIAMVYPNALWEQLR